MCHVIQILLQDSSKCVSTQGWCQAIRKAFEWHLAINTSLRLDIQQTPEAGVSLVGNTLCSVCLHMPLHVLPSHATNQWCWSWELLTQQSESHSEGEKHITSPLPACLTHSAVMLVLLVSMATARCEGSTGKWLQWRFCRQSSSFPCHGNSDRRWIYSDLCTEPILQPVKPHSEVFHLSVLNVHSTQCVGAVETELRTLIIARKASKWK